MQDAREHDDGIWWPLDTRPNLGERITGLTAGSTKTVAVTSNRGQWAYDVDTVIVSHDGGMTWSRAPRSGPEHPTAVWLADDRTGFALGGPPKTESHYVWRTRDGGASWNIVLPR